eukprot:760527-Hanusia_phi.AAC.2
MLSDEFGPSSPYAPHPGPNAGTVPRGPGPTNLRRVIRGLATALLNGEPSSPLSTCLYLFETFRFQLLVFKNKERNGLLRGQAGVAEERGGEVEGRRAGTEGSIGSEGKLKGEQGRERQTPSRERKMNEGHCLEACLAKEIDQKSNI